MSDQPSSDIKQAFLRAIAHRTMLKAYITVIVGDAHLAEDTLSDTTLAIANSWQTYDQTKPFAPWARGVARRVALANLRKSKRIGLLLDDDVLELMGQAIDEFGDEDKQDDRKERLQACVEKLPSKSRDLLKLRYTSQVGYEELSQRTGRTIDALYMAFSRIHKLLFECMERKA